MEKGLNGSTESRSGVVLELFGIDKKWVRGTNGQWIDERDLPAIQSQTQQKVEINEVVEVSRTKKRWQFWKR